MSDTFSQNFPLLDAHVKDYERVEKNAELILLTSLIRFESKPAGDSFGVPVRTSDAALLDTIFFIPSPRMLMDIFEREPTADLRRFFGMIKNIGEV